jgi:hypothetical protein
MHEGHELTVDDLLKLSPRSAYHLQAEGMAPQAARTMDLRVRAPPRFRFRARSVARRPRTADAERGDGGGGADGVVEPR